jgi:hypothetical protein
MVLNGSFISESRILWLVALTEASAEQAGAVLMRPPSTGPVAQGRH